MKTKNVYSRKLKLCKFPLKASVQKPTQIFFAEIVETLEIRKSEILSVIAPRGFYILTLWLLYNKRVGGGLA